MESWLARIRKRVAADSRIARITILSARGPTPREVGAWMLVGAHVQEGKIGRGPLEARAVALAREVLDAADVAGDAPQWLRQVREFATGDVLGASSGGTIEILVEVLGEPELAVIDQPATTSILARPLQGGIPGRLIDPNSAGGELPGAVAQAVLRFRDEPYLARQLVETPQGRWLLERLGSPSVPFYVYGTGLVARALIDKLAGLPFDIVCVDTDASRFASPLPPHARALAVADPAAVAREAPTGSFHIVMTQSHDLDYAIAKALLTRARFGHLGMIGSRMKRKRLEAMLERDGTPASALSRVACPVGLPSIKSKVPAVIAIAIAAEALIALHRLTDAASQVAGSNA